MKIKADQSRLTAFASEILVVCLFFFLAACGGKDTSQNADVKLQRFEVEPVVVEAQTPAESKAESASQGSKSMLPYTIFQEEGKTWFTIAMGEQVQVSPEYQGKILKLNFSPPQPLIEMAGLKSEGVILGVQPIQGEGGSMTALEIALAQDSQYLLSRPDAEHIKVMFVPKKDEKSAAASQPVDYELKKIEFTKDKEGWFYIRLSADFTMEYLPRPGKEAQVKLLFPRLIIPNEYEKLYQLQKFELGVKSALLQNSKEGAELLLAMDKRRPMQVERKDKELIFKIHGVLEAQEKPREIAQSKTDGSKLSQVEDESVQELNTLFPGMRSKYYGDPVSINLQDADAELVLRLIAEVSGYNLILDETITGKISLKLDNVPWDQALDLVLLQKDLGMVLRGNILRVATKQKLQKEQEDIQKVRKSALEAKEALQTLEPLVTEFIQINYAKASDLMPKAKEILSARGKVSNDTRTNLLIVTATKSEMEKVRSIVNKLDRPERQVLIEARVVYATDKFQQSLGLKWGGAAVDAGSQLRPTIYGAQAGGNNIITNPATDPWTSGYAVNLPAAIASGGLGFNIAKILGDTSYTLDAQLQLGEKKNQSKVIASPRIVTLNNQQAEIIQGTKIATQSESASGGTTTEYKDAILKLTVTPQITPDNKLILDLSVTDDAPDGNNISTRSAKTKLIVNDGETIVIGGVNKTTESKTKDRIPGLHKIPVLGWLFKSNYEQDNKEELLIFIRPKIM